LITTGSKYFLGLSVAALIGGLLYGIGNDWGALGAIGLASVMIAAGFLVSIMSYIRDNTSSSLDTEALSTSAAAQAPAQRSLWPFGAALGVAFLAVGVVTYQPVVVIGICIILYTILEWTAAAWSEHASGSEEFNAEARSRLLNPLEFPLLGALLAGTIAFSLSRVMLGIDSKAGAAVFGGAAAVILIVGWIFSHKVSGKIVAGVCAAFLVLVVGAGVATGLNGERKELDEASAEDHFSVEHRDCTSPEEQHFDEDATRAVADKASIQATATFKDGQLTVREVSTHEDTSLLTLPRSSVAHILFRNEDEGDRRLSIALGTEPIEGATDGATKPVVECTALVGKGQQQLLTIRPTNPSAAFPDEPFELSIPGVEGASIQVEVL
jgi:hypothetical protein